MAGIPETVAAFLREHIDSAEQLEVLLLVRGEPEREWTAEDVSARL